MKNYASFWAGHIVRASGIKAIPKRRRQRGSRDCTVPMSDVELEIAGGMLVRMLLPAALGHKIREFLGCEASVVLQSLVVSQNIVQAIDRTR